MATPIKPTFVLSVLEGVLGGGFSCDVSIPRAFYCPCGAGILWAAQDLRATGIISMSMVSVGVFTSEFEAQAVCNRLEAEDIAARMNRQGRYHGFTGAIAVEVDEADAAKAREILGDADAPVDMDEYVAPGDRKYRHCPACHTANVDMAPLTEGKVWLIMLTFGLAALFMKRDCRCRKCGHAWRG